MFVNKVHQDIERGGGERYWSLYLKLQLTNLNKLMQKPPKESGYRRHGSLLNQNSVML